MDFPTRLKRLREEKEQTQTELGKLLNLSKQAISSYENGGSTPPKEVLVKIANYFDVSTDYLLGRTVERIIKVNDQERGLEGEMTLVEACRQRGLSQEMGLKALDNIAEFMKWATKKINEQNKKM